MRTHATEMEPQRAVPVAASVDVLVAGGGPAGIAAGIAAARAGAKTLLVERYGYLGGMITGANVTWIMGTGDGLRKKAMGITEEFRLRLEPLGGVRAVRAVSDYDIDPEVFQWQAAEMLSEAGAGVLLHTWVCAPILRDGRVGGVFTESKSGRQAIRAAVVVDATADADLAFRAGVPCDNETHDLSLGISVTGVDRERVAAFEKESPEEFTRIIEEARGLNGGALPGQPRRIPGIDVADAAALSDMEIRLRRETFEALCYLRRRLPGWEEARVEKTRPQIGVRQGRRIRGRYTLTGAEMLANRHFEDAIARLGAYMTGYKCYRPAGLDYDIPYRCLVPANVDGLLVAGRCVSSDYDACNTLRLIVPCFATGQAAGAAAALAARRNLSPGALPIAELAQELRKQGVHLGSRYPDGTRLPDRDETPVEVQDGD